MESKMTLWQRCEALGPQDDDHIKIWKVEQRDGTGIVWRISHDCHTTHTIYHDGRLQGSPWLADLILQRFEAIELKAVDRACSFKSSELTEPTPNQCKALFEFMVAMDDNTMVRRGLTVEGNARSREIVVIKTLGKNEGFSITMHSFYGFHPTNRTNPVTYIEACDMVGMKLMPSHPPCTHSGLETQPYCQRCCPWLFDCKDDTEPTQQQIKALFEWCKGGNAKNDAQEVMFSWDGDALRSTLAAKTGFGRDATTLFQIEVVVTLGKMYTYSGKPFAEACKLVGFDPNPMPLPDTLSNMEVKYVAEAPKELVSVPVKEWADLKHTIEAIKFSMDSDTHARFMKVWDGLRQNDLPDSETKTNLQS